MRHEAETTVRKVHRATSRVSHPTQNLTGRARWNLVAPVRTRGWHGEMYYVSVGHVSKPYGRSTHTAGYLSHIVQGVLMVWQNGRYIGSLAIWRCAARSAAFRLLDEPDSTICPACTIVRVPRERS